MTETRKFQLTLEEGDAKVLAAALSVLPLILDGETLNTLLATIDDHDHKLLVVMTAALMAGAEHTATMQDEMSDDALSDNVQRGAALLTKIHDWLHPSKEEAKVDGDLN